jgi:hypothetical protein
VSAGLAASKGEASRLIRQGGLYVNDRRLNEERGYITMADAIGRSVIVLRKGQRERRIVKVDAQVVVLAAVGRWQRGGSDSARGVRSRLSLLSQYPLTSRNRRGVGTLPGRVYCDRLDVREVVRQARPGARRRPVAPNPKRSDFFVPELFLNEKPSSY